MTFVENCIIYYNDIYSESKIVRAAFFLDIARVISNWYATRSSNNTTIYMDLGESSTSFRIHCLEFYFPRYSVACLFPCFFLSLSRSCSLSLFFPCPRYFSFSPLGSLSSISRIAPPGISEVLSRIQRLASSLMDGSAILFRSAPLRARAYTSCFLSCVAPFRVPTTIRPLDG